MIRVTNLLSILGHLLVKGASLISVRIAGVKWECPRQPGCLVILSWSIIHICYQFKRSGPGITCQPYYRR